MTRKNPEGGGSTRARKETAAQRAAREWQEEEAIMVDLTARFGPFYPPTQEQYEDYLRMEAEDQRRRQANRQRRKQP